MASIRKRAGKWDVRWRDPDGSERTRACPSAGAAKALKREVEDCVAGGRRWEPRDARARARLRDIAGAYVTACARRLRPRSLIRYAQHLETFVGWADTDAGTRGGAYVDVLTEALVERFYDALIREPWGRHGRMRSPATAAKHVEVVHLMWAWAERREEWEGQVPRYRPMDVPAPAPQDPTVAPTWAEMDAAISAARGWYRPLLILLRCTGLRVGQVIRLRWEDLDLAAGVLTIRGELGKSGAESRGRRVPVAEVLLQELRAPTLATWGESWLVPLDRDPREVRARDVARIWRRAKVREAAWKGRPDHCFRRGFVSGLRQVGAQGDAVEFLVGHVLPGMLAPYVDADIGLPLRDAVARMPPIIVTAPPPQRRAAPSRARVLEALREHGPRTSAELAELLHLDPRDLRRVVAAAVVAGDVVRLGRRVALP